MATIKSISVALTRAAAAFALSLSTAAPAKAFDWSSNMAAAPASYVGEFGTRLWFGHARTGKNLFNVDGSLLVSRLDYYDMSVFTGEAFARFDGNTGWFLKGYAGGGGLFGGRLKDEDFPPFIDPYSATLSDQRDGSLFYGSVDAGIKVLRGPDFHVGAFVGYHFLRSYVDAWGCGQIGTNPEVCGGGIPDFIRGISQVHNWHSLRVGLEASVAINARWTFTVDAAWLPYARLYGADSHLLRIGQNPGDFTGPIPEEGRGWGYQIDAIVTYRVNDWLHVGAGGRYWQVEAKGHTHFEGHVVGANALPQAVEWRAQHFGGFFQASVKFGPNRLITTN